MSRPAGPQLKRYMEKMLSVKLNGNRVVEGRLRGFDDFMNIVLSDASEVVDGEKTSIGQVVRVGDR